MYLLARAIAVSFVLSFCHASPTDLHDRAIDCSDPKVKSLVSTVRAVASAAIDPFCSSYLHYIQSVTTTTVLTTSTFHVTSTIKKGIVIVTTTVVESGKKPKRECQTKRDPRPAPVETITADSAGKVYGFAADIVSGACSCLVTKPFKPSTVIKTSTTVVTSTIKTTVQETKTVTVTTKVQPSTTKGSSTTKSASSTTKTINSSSTTKSQPTTKTTSGSKTSSTSATLTQCDTANPTFQIQFRDPTSRTDAYNNQYLFAAPDTYRNTGNGYVWATTPVLSSALKVYLELSTGRVRTVAEGWYANADYFVSLAPVHFDTAAVIDPNEWQYMSCSITNGLLSCYVEYPGGRGVMQTCPEYVEYYYTPVALGDKEYRMPNCYQKNMVVIPICTPKM